LALRAALQEASSDEGPAMVPGSWYDIVQLSLLHGPPTLFSSFLRSGDGATFVTFIYEKDSERLLRHVTGSDEDEVILQSLAWSEKHSQRLRPGSR
jgi:hypothetical protein